MSEVKTNKISSLASNNDITIDPDGTGDVVVASGHKLGVSTASPTTTLQVGDGSADTRSTLNPSSAFAIGVKNGANHGGFIGSNGSSGMQFSSSGGAARMTIDSSGLVGVSNTSPSSYFDGSRELVVGASGDTGITVASGSSSLGSIFFADGTSGGQRYEGQIRYDHSNNRMFFAAGGTGHVFIDSNGALLVGKTSAGLGNNGFEVEGNNGATLMTRQDNPPQFVNRNGNDGNLIVFRQANTDEGSITVNGTTVSFNGGHLARWSQLADNAKDTSIVKGTVMTNLDQMAVWHHEAQAATYYTEDDELPDGVSVGDEKTPAVDAYDEDNEQLNCMAVSSVEGDANVAGVFVNWDDDDTDFTADMNIAMTGDIVIRIAQGTTVARGDLLMSAGDGTAKPQDDDIVRSKTIAKVTSTTKSHTYDDGSYLVPCVLMAC